MKKTEIAPKVIRTVSSSNRHPAPKVTELRFKTITRNVTKMVPVRIDRKTVVFAPEGSDMEAIRKKYLDRVLESTQYRNPIRVGNRLNQ